MTESQPSNSPQVRYGQPSSDRSVVPGFGPAGAIAGVTVVLVLLGGLAWAAAASHTVAAQRPHLFGGYLVLEDDSRPFPVIDLATGNLTVRIQGVNMDVRANSYQDVQAVPVDAGTMLVNRTDGTFNLLGTDNFVLDTVGGGVGLGPPLPGLTGASAVGAGSGAYIVRYASPASSVSLVDQATVESGAKLELGTAHLSGPRPAVTPRGFARLAGPVLDQPGSSTAVGGDLWVLVERGPDCQVVQLHPVAAGHNGLLQIPRGILSGGCRQMAIEAEGGTVGVASPGQVRLFSSDSARAGLDARVSTGSASRFLPVAGGSSSLWYLARQPTGWGLFGVSPAGRATQVSALRSFGPRADPVPPVVSGDLLYTLDQNQSGQPTLWSIGPANGAMIPVSVGGSTTYPAAGKSEKASFRGTQVLQDGPRVIFNNPGSLDAVVLFTDGSRPPVVVDKSLAENLSSTSPNLVANQSSGSGSSKTRGSRSSAQYRSVPVVQSVNQSISCATTTQKPYAPQIASISPSSGSALITWSYQLLDVTDCEPDSWSVHVTAISSSHQPDQPIQLARGQDQLEFTGLRPATTYQVVVTAYINTQSTPSEPATFTTAPRGPDAPTAVHTTVTPSGNWVVSWVPCTTAKCVVPADQWNVVGSACGSSFVGQPPTVQVSGAQDSVTLNADSLGLLGDSLTFSVNGQLASGLSGNPTSDGECSQSWRAPLASEITVAGAGTVSGQTVTARLQVATSSSVSPTEALGSKSTEYVFHVGPVTLPPTASPTATVPGLAAGQTYVPSVTVYPAAHPQAAVTVSGPPFTQNLPWPLQTAADASFAVDSNPNLGTATIAVPGYAQLLPGQLYASSGNYTCGNTQSPLPPMVNGVITIPNIDLDGFSGTCAVSFTVSDLAVRNNPYGGVPSPPIMASFDATNPSPPSYSLSAEFSSDVCLQSLLCEYVTVSAPPTEAFPAGDTWNLTASGGSPGNPNGCDTSMPLSTPPQFPQTLTLPCGPDDATYATVEVTYRYLGATQVALNATPSGTPVTTTTTTSTTSTTTSTTTTSSVPQDTTTSVSQAGTAPSASSGAPSAAGGVPSARSGAPSAGSSSGAPSAGAAPSARPSGAQAGGASRPTELAAAQGTAQPVRPGQLASRHIFELTLVILGVALFAGMGRRIPRRRKQLKVKGDS